MQPASQQQRAASSRVVSNGHGPLDSGHVTCLAQAGLSEAKAPLVKVKHENVGVVGIN